MDRVRARFIASLGAASWRRATAGGLVGLAVALVASGSSCVAELDGHIACGDGYVDKVSGEECEPGDPESFAHGCRVIDRPMGEPACDPESCTVVSTIEQCAVCGDGEVDEEAGEECEVGMVMDQCPWGVGLMRCGDDCTLDDSLCGTCGNGEVELELGEECDPNKPGDVALVRNCEDLQPLTDNGDYAGGAYRECGDDCLYSRVACNYCGNLELDGALAVDLEGHSSPPEVCDGYVFDEAYIQQRLSKSICYQGENGEEGDLRPVVTCDSSCTDIHPADTEQVCCVKRDRPCPLPESGRKCCYELERSPSITDAVCQDKVILGQAYEHVCR